MPSFPAAEDRIRALHSLWEHVIRAMAHTGLHGEDADAVVAAIKARIAVLRGRVDA